MYNIQKFNNSTSVWYEQDGMRISFTLDNVEHIDCQKYLEWLALGNTPKEWIMETA